MPNNPLDDTDADEIATLSTAGGNDVDGGDVQTAFPDLTSAQWKILHAIAVGALG